MYNTSIYENVTLGDDDFSIEEVIEAAKEVGVHDFIAQLEGGYQFQVKERGGVLSSDKDNLFHF